MAAKAQTQDLEDLLNQLQRSADGAGGQVSVERIVDAIGRRSFGPLLLLTGLLGMTPVSAVPGAPSVLGLITVLTAAQLLFGRHSIWLPRFLLRLSVGAEQLEQTVRIARRPAQFVDRMVNLRLKVFTGPVADRAVALICMLLGAMIPPLELLPFVAFFPALAIAFFGLGLIARDGLLVLIGLVISAGVVGLAVHHFIL